MSSYTWDLGLIINVNTFLVLYEPDKIRSARWYDTAANSISLEYGADSNSLCMAVNVEGVLLMADTLEVETSEWNGDDNLWHNLSVELVGNEILGLRDDKILFQLVDERLLDFEKTGFLQLSVMGAQVCFDDISLTSVSPDPLICGDSNGDESVNVSDAVFIINYVFVNGPEPDPLESADANCDASVNVSDAVWIINYVFVGGNQPCDIDGDNLPDCLN